AAWTKETADLNTIADAYTQCVLRNKTVPGLATWASDVASQLSLPANAVTNTPRGTPRMFLIDPNLRMGTNAGSTLTYIQDANGSTNPASARVMLLSSLSYAMPVGSNDFNDIW